MWGLDKNAGFTVSRSLFSLEWTKMCDPGGEARGFRFAGGYGGLVEGVVWVIRRHVSLLLMAECAEPRTRVVDRRW